MYIFSRFGMLRSSNNSDHKKSLDSDSLTLTGRNLFNKFLSFISRRVGCLNFFYVATMICTKDKAASEKSTIRIRNIGFCLNVKRSHIPRLFSQRFMNLWSVPNAKEKYWFAHWTLHHTFVNITIGAACLRQMYRPARQWQAAAAPPSGRELNLTRRWRQHVLSLWTSWT
jgi:hypothetical protein